MNMLSGDATIVVLVGLGFFSDLKDVVMVLLLSVSMIMLAKPTIIATIIPIERRPPVKVRYSPSF